MQDGIPDGKSLYRTARKAYCTKTLWVLHKASCVVTPAQCEHEGPARYWLLSYGTGGANIGVLPFVKVGQFLFRRFGLAVELSQVPYHSQPHSHRTESLKLCFVSSRLQIAHARIHITHLAGRRKFVQTVSALWAFSIRMAAIAVIPYILIAPSVPNWSRGAASDRKPGKSA